MGITWAADPAAQVSVLTGTPYRLEQLGDRWLMTSIEPSIEAIIGYSAQELVGESGRSWATIIHPDDVDAVTVLFRGALEAGGPYAIEYRLLHRDGSTRWVQGHGQPVAGPDG
ncbi:MAG TPA: PAS domain-containing protein, partial [Gaiellales bacterium]